MLAAGIKTPVPLEELENHLRDEIARQTKSGQSETQAFESAVQKIGSAQTVQNEFEKVGDIGEERQWKEGQIWLGVILGSLQLPLIGSVLLNSEMTFGQRMSGLAAIATSFLLVAVARLSHRVFPVIPIQRNRTLIGFIAWGVTVIIWFSIFRRSLLPGQDFGQWLTTVLWTSCPPLGLFLGLIWGIETATREKIAASH